MGSAPWTLKLPVVKPTPSRCQLKYSLDLDERIEEIAKVNKDGDVVFSGTPTKPLKAGVYKIKVQAKTPRGRTIKGANFDFSVEIEKRPNAPAAQVPTIVAATTGVASVANAAAAANTRPRAPRGPRVNPTRGGG